MEIIKRLSEGKSLDPQEAEAFMESIISGTISGAQAGACLMGLKMKGETPAEISGFAKVLRNHSVKIFPKAKYLVDTCGTGGDGLCTFNISTAAAIIAAGAGAPVAKHGNKSVSSRSGSFDVLERLGIKALKPESVEKCINENSIGFMFAPYFNPAMAKIAPVRKELGIRTVFNVMGPLLNPAGAKSQVVGVYSSGLTAQIAETLGALGSERALVVNSGGMDELGLGITNVSELRNGKVESYEIDSKEFGLSHAKLPAVDSPEQSAKVILEILNGKKGPERDVACLNAGSAIYVSGRAKSIGEGVEMAFASVDSGDALKKLGLLKDFSGLHE